MSKTETKDVKGSELVRQSPAPLVVAVEDDTLDVTDKETRDMLEAMEREMAVGFQHTNAKDIYARDEPFAIIDAIYTTMEEEVEYRGVDGNTYKQMEEKPKIVWVLRMSKGGETLTCMQSFRGPRKKFLQWFDNVRASGQRGEISPVKFKSVKAGKYPEPALVFDLLPGFNFRKFPVDMQPPVAA